MRDDSRAGATGKFEVLVESERHTLQSFLILFVVIVLEIAGITVVTVLKIVGIVKIVLDAASKSAESSSSGILDDKANDVSDAAVRLAAAIIALLTIIRRAERGTLAVLSTLLSDSLLLEGAHHESRTLPLPLAGLERGGSDRSRHGHTQLLGFRLVLGGEAQVTTLSSVPDFRRRSKPSLDITFSEGHV